MNRVAESVFLLEKVHSYYSSAFDQALVVVGIVFGVVGVIVPVGISYFQARQARKEFDAIKESISVEVSRQLLVLLENLKREQDVALAGVIDSTRDELEKFRSEAQQQFKLSDAGIFHVQALHLRKSGQYGDALLSSAKAAIRYFEGSDKDNLRSAMEIAKGCISQLATEKSGGRGVVEYEKAMDLIEGAKHGAGVSDIAHEAREVLSKARLKWGKAVQPEAKNV